MRVTRAALALFTVLVLQTTLFADLAVFGVHADIVLLYAIAAGIIAGPDKGALAGFAAGLGYDLLVIGTPVGLYALAYCLTGYAVGTLQSTVLRASWWIPMVSAMGASALGVAAFAIIGSVLGQPDFLDRRVAKVAIVVALINGALVLPALRVARWAAPAERRSRLAL
ncbi:MAG: rod shape-determining protein MreD [Acidimicrobiales bacterium]